MRLVRLAPWETAQSQIKTNVICNESKKVMIGSGKGKDLGKEGKKCINYGEKSINYWEMLLLGSKF